MKKVFAASFVPPPEGNAFAFSIVTRIVDVNVAAFTGLLLFHRPAINLGLLSALRQAASEA